MGLVTLEQAKRHLRVDDDQTAFDPDIELLIEGISDLVLIFVKASEEDYMDEDGELTFLPRGIQIATLVWIGIVFKNRDGTSDEKLELGEIPRTVSSLLWPYRKLTME